MNLKKSILGVIILTTLAVFYVDQQVKIVITGYQLEQNMSKIELLIDKNEKLEYNVNRLNSPSYLYAVLNKDLDDRGFILSKNVEVRRVNIPSVDDTQTRQASSVGRGINLFSFLFSTTAEAETVDY